MPKRRMSSRRRNQIRLWQLASVKARGKPLIKEWGSYSDPHLGREKLGWSSRKQRTIKYMGKAATHANVHSSSVTIAPWAKQMLAGEKPSASRLMPDPSTIHGEMVIKDGSEYRLPRPKTVAKTNGQNKVGQAKIAMADKAGMSVAELKKKMAADSRKMTAELKKQNGLKANPFKKMPGPGKGK